MTNTFCLRFLGMLGTDDLHQLKQIVVDRHSSTNTRHFVKLMNRLFNLSDTTTTASTTAWMDKEQKVMDDSHHDPDTTKTMPTRTSARPTARVTRYYNAHTVQKVLEYMCIDYVLLGLPIPQWAEDLLQQDKDKKQQLLLQHQQEEQ